MIKKQLDIQLITKYFLRLLLLAVILLSVFSTYHITGNILDSDASSELVLAEHIYKTGQYFPTEWFYSTEIRVLYMQLIYAPLFFLFNDWHIIRFVGAVIMQLLLVLSYSYMIKKAKLDSNLALLGSSLFLLPTSIAYGRIVLYHCFYIFFAIVSFFILGLIFSLTDNSGKVLKTLKYIVLISVSLLAGLSGVRYLLILYAPLFLGVFSIAFINDFKTDKPTLLNKEFISLLIPAGVSTFSALIGYYINSNILPNHYSFADYTEYSLSLIHFDSIRNMISSFFSLFGFKADITLISFDGAISLLCAIIAIYAIIASFVKLIKNNKEESLNQRLVQLFFLFSATTTALIFIFTGGSSSYFFVLYIIPVFFWAIPFLTFFINNIFNTQSHILNAKVLVPFAMIIVMFLNSFINLLYFHGFYDNNFVYDGLSFKNKSIVNELSGAVDYLSENDYDLGYASFWNSNIVTELTDGDTKMINVNFSYNSGKLYYYNWLSLSSNRTIDPENSFVLLSKDEQDLINLLIPKGLSLVYEDDYYIILHINNHEDFINNSVF